MPSNQPRVSFVLPQELYDEAKKYDINLSKAARAGIENAIAREKKIEELLH